MVSHRQESFLARVVELGLEDVIPKFKAKGLTTFARYAYGSDYNPQLADTTILNTQLLTPLADGNVDLVPVLRMLWWESWGIATADMRRQAEPEPDAPRKLGAPELKARREEVLGKLPGLTVTKELDISDQLLQECVGIHDSNRVKYVPWEACTARSMEVIGEKTEAIWTKDASTGFLKADAARSSPTAEVGTEYQLDLALKRRGLALAMADLIDFAEHEKLRQDLMCALTRKPIPGYDRVSFAQLRRADETAFTLLAQFADGGIKRAGGVRPLDACIQRVLDHRDYNHALQPLPAAPPPPPKRQHDDEGGESRRARKRRLAAENQQTTTYESKGRSKGNKGNGKAKGDTGGKGKLKTASIPGVLRYLGVAAADSQGSPICFSFNSDGCDGAPPGGRCPKGRHICMLQSCGQNHGFLSHHKPS